LAGRPLSVVILAAGPGKRFKSQLAKVLIPVAGRPIIRYLVDTARALEPERVIVVVGYQAEKVKAYLGQLPGVEYVLQEKLLGTGHAFKLAVEAMLAQEADKERDILILCGDTPLLRPETLVNLAETHYREGATASVVTVMVSDPVGYGRVLRDEAGSFTRIVEDADVAPAERDIREVNAGIYCFLLADILPFIDRLTMANRQREYYLPDILFYALAAGRKVLTVKAEDSGEVQGVNNRVQLAEAEAWQRRNILRDLMLSGVTVTDPASTYVDWGVIVGQDTVLEPGTVLRGATRIGRGCVIGPWSQLEDAIVGDGCRVWVSVVEKSELAANVSVGPFSHLRPDTRLGEGAKVGNFAEIKNSTVGSGTKIPHHTYVGDADIGAAVNFGAGSVVVNYDGQWKSRTAVADGALVGCNTNLVAPVKVGEGAYTAAGSTITRDVPPGALAVARGRQENLEGWVERRRPGTVSAKRAREAGEAQRTSEVREAPGADAGAESGSHEKG